MYMYFHLFVYFHLICQVEMRVSRNLKNLFVLVFAFAFVSLFKMPSRHKGKKNIVLVLRVVLYVETRGK